ncbi:MAG: hydroxymethylbilane synthase [Lachnospiraceae bacterium]|nr:hydroxymethylbilane synthase [Lachnospiraceae bacterium]
MRRIVVGSRDSKLAIIQSMTVVDHINETLDDGFAELQTMKTTGDKILDRTLDKVGGKGLFVKELDLALKLGRVDVTVHSLKDVPMEIDKEIPLLAFSRREDPRDVLILPEGKDEVDPDLPIGSSSLRRVLQLKKLYPDHKIEPVRGNLQTRLKKLDEGQYGALVLAAAGIKRLGLENRISRYFTVDEIIPAAGQGIMVVQGRAADAHDYLEGYEDPDARNAALCERAYVRELDGGCTSPVCAHAEVADGKIFLRALYYEEATGEYLTGTMKGRAKDAEKIGIELARQLRDNKE